MCISSKETDFCHGSGGLCSAAVQPGLNSLDAGSRRGVLSSASLLYYRASTAIGVSLSQLLPNCCCYWQLNFVTFQLNCIIQCIVQLRLWTGPRNVIDFSAYSTTSWSGGQEIRYIDQIVRKMQSSRYFCKLAASRDVHCFCYIYWNECVKNLIHFSAVAKFLMLNWI